MKKGIASISLFVYLLVSCGVIVNFHYCMDRFDSLQLFVSSAEVCGKCGMHVDDSMGCCRDEVKIIKMEEDQKVHNETSFELPILSTPAQLPSVYLNTLFVNVSEQRHHRNHSPPLLDEGETYLKICVFRI